MTHLQDETDIDESVDADLEDALAQVEEAIRASLPGAARMLDRTPPGSIARQEMLQDLMRGAAGSFPVEAALAFLHDLGGWEPVDRTDQEVVSMGDFLCDVEIGGETWPVVTFGAMATPFDEGDPLLICLTDHLRGQADRVCLLQMHPTFQALTDREGRVTRFVLFGGWLIDATACRPFCIEPGGSEGLLEQTHFFRTSRISRGFFRDRGHDGKRLEDVIDAQIAIDNHMADRHHEISSHMHGDKAVAPSDGGFARSDYTLATGQGEWSFFVKQQMADQIGDFQSLMAEMAEMDIEERG